MATRKWKWNCYNMARALGYEKVMPDIKERIYAAVMESDVSRIMATARNMLDNYEKRWYAVKSR